MTARLVKIIAGAVVVVVLAGGTLALVRGRRHPVTVYTATFAEAPGLYVGNHVDVLGIPVGTVTAIKPQPLGVEITMKVNAAIKVPAQAKAVLMAPQVVNDRFVELAPAYSGGPVMAAGTHLPESRTIEPLSVDQVLGSLNSLFTALGPSAIDQKGALATLVHQLVVQLGGQGSALHTTIGATSSAVNDLAADAPGLSQTLTKLSTLIGTLAADAGNYTSFTNTFAAVAADFNGDRSDLANALNALQTALGDVSTFVQTNSANFGASLNNLETLASTLAAKQSQLASALHITPLALQNLARTVHQTPTGPAIMGRFDPVRNSLGLTQQICGNLLERAVQLSVEQAQAPVIDPVCAFGAGVASFRIPPGGATGPDLSLSALLSGRSS